MDRSALLVDAYLENDLTLEERAELCDCLRRDEEAVDRFVRESYLHAQLFSILRQRALQADVLASPSPDVDELLLPFPSCDVPQVHARSRHARRRAISAMLTLAGAIVVAATILLWTRQPAAAVAQLTQTTASATWERGMNRTAGTILHRGQELRLGKGRILATMVSGARIVLEGPAVLRMTSDNSVQLLSGRVSAVVPPQAIGFTVKTTLGDFVDLGTEFTLELDDAGCRLYVFSGLVEMRPAGDSVDNPPFQVPQTRAVSYDAATGEAKLISYSEEFKMSL